MNDDGCRELGDPPKAPDVIGVIMGQQHPIDLPKSKPCLAYPGSNRPGATWPADVDQCLLSVRGQVGVRSIEGQTVELPDTSAYLPRHGPLASLVGWSSWLGLKHFGCC